MTNKHTPGPWRLELIDKWPFGIRVIGSNGDEVLHQVAHAHSTKQKSRKDCENGVGFVGPHEFSKDEAILAIATQDANARLIAAAPETSAERDRLKEINAELLAALVVMEKEKSEYMWSNHLGDPSEEDTNKMDRASIAKATGQALQDLADIGQELNV